MNEYLFPLGGHGEWPPQERIGQGSTYFDGETPKCQ